MSQEKGFPVTNFIHQIIDADLASGKHKSVITRFPPEPNGYLHIGHAKSICLNFGTAKKYGGRCHLRFDDTNPSTEEVEFIDSIKADVEWLGFDWGDHLYFASDYFEKLYDFAIQLIGLGKAYVCSLSQDQMREYRGTLTSPGKPSPDRNRTVAENLDLFKRMRAGEFPDGTYTLRAKIDMASPNINMRDPAIYRIKRMSHPKTGDKWCIYPMYDYTHCLSDMLEGITHSLCTLEFEDHRPLYDWVLETLKTPCHPQQIEFAKLFLSHVVTSKRRLKSMVEEKRVSGWDDPRMPTLVGLRRRGFPPAAIRRFCDRIGVSKKETVMDMTILEDFVRDELNEKSGRLMAVLSPLKVTIENYDDGKEESFEAPNHPKKPEMGTRKVPFSKTLYIEKEDYLENPPKDFYRLGPGREVRLRYGYIMKCEKAIYDPKSGELSELRCTIDKNTLGKNPEGRKVKGIIHWVSAKHAVKAEIRNYDRLFTVENPGGDEYLNYLNPDSLNILSNSLIEPAVLSAQREDCFQFERKGYYCLDRRDAEPGKKLVFNRTVSLRDTWSTQTE